MDIVTKTLFSQMRNAMKKKVENITKKPVNALVIVSKNGKSTTIADGCEIQIGWDSTATQIFEEKLKSEVKSQTGQTVKEVQSLNLVFDFENERTILNLCYKTEHQTLDFNSEL
jgi:hypothetical protein